MRSKTLALFLYFSLSLAQLCFSMSLNDSIETLSPSEKECYRWHALHAQDALEVPEDELWAYLEGKPSEIADDRGATRDIEIALYIARVNGYLMDSSQLREWSELALNSDERDLSAELVDEIATNLVRSGVDTKTKDQLLFSENARLREAIFAAMSLYGDEQSRVELFKRYQALEEGYQRRLKEAVKIMQHDYEQGEELIHGIKRERNTNLSSYKELADYMHYQTNGVAQDLSGGGLLEWMGRHLVHKIGSTSADIYGGGGAFLASSLMNFYWLERMSSVLEGASTHEERLELENAYRKGFRESQPGNMRHAVRLYYLLGFELTEEELAYLLEETGLPENQILPSGQIHLIGYELESSQALLQIPTPPAAVVETTEKEGVDEPAGVKLVEVAEETPEQSSQWWLWLIGAIVVVGGVLFIRSKNERP
jgi:hypothetical protein